MERKAREYKSINDGEALPENTVLTYFTVQDGKPVEHVFVTGNGGGLDAELEQ